MEWQGVPGTIYQGDTVQFRLFARGALPDWQMHWRWSNSDRHSPSTSWPVLGFFTPADTAGAQVTVNFTATTPGVSNFYVYMEDGDWRTNDLQCETTRPIFVSPPACVPQCVAGQLCGGPDGCGGVCANTDNGVPPAVTITYPGSDGLAAPVSGQVTLTWNPNSTVTDKYYIEVLPQGDTCLTSTAPGHFCGEVTTNSYVLNVDGSVLDWTVRVTGINSSCLAFELGPTTSRDFTLVGGITGNFYMDRNISCTVSGATPLQALGTGGTVTVTDRNSSTNPATLTAGNTGYSATVPYWPAIGNNVVTVRPGTIGATQLRCACNANGADSLTCVKGGINSPQAGVNFFLTDRLPIDAWYQVINGSLYAALNGAGSTGIRSYVPDQCLSPGCIPFIAAGIAAQVDSAGIGVTGGSGIDTEATAGNSRARLTQRTPSTTAAIGTTMAKREDYGYFSRLYDMVSTDATTFDDFDGSPGRSAADNALKPTLVPRSGKAAYITDGDMTISQAWIVNDTEKIVVFVPGDLYINDPSSLRTLITVAQGGFLGFIVQGNIIISENVGYPPPYASTAPNLEGVFIADGVINTLVNTSGENLKFIGAGNFIGWGGLSLQRDLGIVSGNNEIFPAESFVARPDFIKNIPLQMTSSSSTWQEVN